jgi:hypothetical protein
VSFLSPSTPDSRTRSSSLFSSALGTPDSSYVASPTSALAAPVIPYDARTEAAPTHALFTERFQNALKQGSEIAQKAVKAIEKMQAGAPRESESEVGKFLSDAKGLQRFQGTDTRTIAVLGDSGEGKIFLNIPPALTFAKLSRRQEQSHQLTPALPRGRSNGMSSPHLP